MGDLDREFHRFLDEYPIHDPLMIEFNKVTARAYAFGESEKYKRRLESLLGADDDTDAYMQACRMRDEFKYRIIDESGSEPTWEQQCYRKEAQRARDRELGRTMHALAKEKPLASTARSSPVPSRRSEDELDKLSRNMYVIGGIVLSAYFALAVYVAYWATNP